MGCFVDQIWPEIEIEFSGKKYKCKVDLGWAYRLESKFDINLLDPKTLTARHQIRDYVRWIWAALVKHEPDITPDEIAEKMCVNDIQSAGAILGAFLKGTFDQQEKKTK